MGGVSLVASELGDRARDCPATATVHQSQGLTENSTRCNVFILEFFRHRINLVIRKEE